MTFSSPRSTRPAVKVFFAAVIATLGVLGSAGLAALSHDGSAVDFSTAAYGREMAGQTDAMFEVEEAAGSTTLAVSVNKETWSRRATRLDRMWSRSWHRHLRWLITRRDGPGISSRPPVGRPKPTTPPVTVDAPPPEDQTTTNPPPTGSTTTAKPGDKKRTTSTRPTRSTAPTTSEAPTTNVPVTNSAPASTAARSTSSKAPISTAPTTGPMPSTSTVPSTNTAPSTSSAPTTGTTPPPSTPPPSEGVYRVTMGSGNATEFDSSSAPGEVSAHGTRLYCVTSHFSHDDPVVFPGRPGASHAHMYWGNTGANASSTRKSLQTSGNSSCEGGITNRSAYWIPALFNSADEVVIPESIFVYYKSFGGPGFDRSTLRSIPAGLEMLATTDVRGAGDWAFGAGGNDAGTELKIRFPECVAVYGNGQPALSADNNVSHLSYATENGTASGCPSSHPYRIPTVSYVIRFDVPYNSNWYLASDESTTTKGQSLHADYVAAWDDDAMSELVECTITARRSCEFPGRGQLPERFLAPDGTRIYQYSVLLEPDADRTPFGAQIPKYSR